MRILSVEHTRVRPPRIRPIRIRPTRVRQARATRPNSARPSKVSTTKQYGSIQVQLIVTSFFGGRFFLECLSDKDRETKTCVISRLRRRLRLRILARSLLVDQG